MLVENRQFILTPPYLAPPLGVARLNFAEIFGIRN